MSYRIKKDKVEELKDGRTATYISNKIGCTPKHIREVLKGTRNCSKNVAISLITINSRNFLELDKIDDLINLYFDKAK